MRTDIWREGKWLDMWSVVHFLSGISIGLCIYFLQIEALASVIITLLLLIAYEMWEMLVHIEEAPTNRFMDVVVGMISFLPTFFILAPAISEKSFILYLSFVLILNIVMSVLGWHASQKAAALKQRVRTKIAAEREKIRRRKQNQH